MNLPPNVLHVAHAIAADEKRREFPMTPLNASSVGQQFSQRVFRGDHADIGGQYEKDQNILALMPLFYVWAKGREVGVPFGTISLTAQGQSLFLEVAGERRPWPYQMGNNPHDMTTLLIYANGGMRANLP
jgi:hypothetical protein